MSVNQLQTILAVALAKNRIVHSDAFPGQKYPLAGLALLSEGPKTTVVALPDFDSFSLNEVYLNEKTGNLHHSEHGLDFIVSPKAAGGNMLKACHDYNDRQVKGSLGGGLLTHIELFPNEKHVPGKALDLAGKRDNNLFVDFHYTLSSILDWTPFQEEWSLIKEGPSAALSYDAFPGSLLRIDVAPGAVMKTEMPNGGRMLIVGTVVGAVGIAEYNPEEKGTALWGLLVFCPPVLNPLLQTRTLSFLNEAAFTLIINRDNIGDNIGTRLQALDQVVTVLKRNKERKVREEEEFKVSGLSYLG